MRRHGANDDNGKESPLAGLAEAVPEIPLGADKAGDGDGTPHGIDGGRDRLSLGKTWVKIDPLGVTSGGAPAPLGAGLGEERSEENGQARCLSVDPADEDDKLSGQTFKGSRASVFPGTGLGRDRTTEGGALVLSGTGLNRDRQSEAQGSQFSLELVSATERLPAMAKQQSPRRLVSATAGLPEVSELLRYSQLASATTGLPVAAEHQFPCESVPAAAWLPEVTRHQLPCEPVLVAAVRLEMAGHQFHCELVPEAAGHQFFQELGSTAVRLSGSAKHLFREMTSATTGLP